MKRILLICFVLMSSLISEALAQRTVTGKVSDATGEGIPGVTVRLKGTSTGVNTDFDGNYRLSAPADGGTLVFSFVGYLRVEEAIGSRSVVDVTLQEDVKQLQEVVVVGYGTQEKREITGSIASVGSKELENLPIASVDQALQGRAAGVQVTQSSGTPGSGISVKIRGVGSISASSEPLYVVDGVPINTGSYTAIGSGGQLTNALSDLNPNDIASMEVLKDAAATAIYGSRAANGVVLITTKKGSAGKTKIDFSAYTGIQQRRNDGVEKLSGPDQVALYTEMIQNRYPRNADGEISALGVNWASYADLAGYYFSDARLNTNADGRYVVIDNGDGVRDVSTFANPETASTTNWLDEIFRTAPISQYDLSFSGGNENTTFRASGTYFNQEGIQIGSGFERLSGRLNLTNKINERARFGVNLGLSRSTNVRPQNDNNINGVLSTALLVAEDIPVYRENGTYYKDPGASTENPVAAGTEPFFQTISSRVLSNAYFEYDLLDGLTFRTNAGIDYLSLQDQRFQPTTTNTGAGSNGLGQESNRSDMNWLWESTLNYNKTFSDRHDFAALLGVSYQESIYENMFAEATVFPGNSIRRLSAGSVKTEATSGGSSWGIASYFSRFNYAFDGKYLASFSIRADGSSRFGANNQWGIFPAGSVGWRISEEAFMQNVDVVSDLKLRASYGITGNQEIDNFASRPLYGVGQNYIQMAGLYPTQLANPDLSWERQEQVNYGIDLGLFRNRLYLSAEYYIMNNNELLLNRPLVGSSGFTSIEQNIGSIRNEGVEIGLTTVNVDNGKFYWSTNFNFSVNKNRIETLSGSPYGAGFASWVEEGYALGSFRGYRVDRIIRTQEDLDIARGQGQGTAQLGDILFKDLDDNGVLNSADQEVMGNAQPDFFGGITNTLSYKGFDLSFFFQYSYGNMIYNNTRAFSEGMNGVFGQTTGVLDRWTPENPDASLPRAVYGDPNNNRRVSDRWLEDGSYIRLKNLSFGYRLPESVLERIHLRSARVYVAGQNLLTFTNYSGMDPEVSTFNITNISPGTDFLTYPQAQTFTVGVNIGL